MEAIPASASVTVMNELVLPSDGNSFGTAFGGRVLQWIDICGAIAAQRHCRLRVVTASMDAVHFHAPIRVGTVASLEARVQATFRRSLEVEVRVHGEDPIRGERKHCCSALMTFTALDDSFHSTDVPPLRLETPEDAARQAAAEARRAARLRLRNQSLGEEA